MKNACSYRVMLGAFSLSAMLAACNGTASAPTSSLPAGAAARTEMDGQGSWIKPGAAKSDLLYVTSPYNAQLYIFSYPRLELVGTIGKYGQDASWYTCTDAKGNVFVPLSLEQKVLEFRHGQVKPAATIKFPNAYPYSCATDPTTGDLAVDEYVSNRNAVAIFTGETGTPTVYADPYVSNTPWGAYDNQGNLFYDGQNAGQGFALSELPKGATAFMPLTIDGTIKFPGSVQWDGKYITVFDTGPGAIDRLSVSGSTATVVGTTSMNDANGGFGLWIFEHRIILANQARNAVQIFPYPAGGTFVKSKALYQASWPVISVAPSR